MSINVMEIKTPESIKAVNRIKSSVKNDGLGLHFQIPKEFVEKKNYMKTHEFIADEHNAKMLKFGELLYNIRRKISQNIIEHNKMSNDELVQGVNGFSRMKKYLDVNYKLNFSKTSSFYFKEENDYGLLKDFMIGNLARKAKKVLGIK